MEVIKLDSQGFRDKVYDFVEEENWNYKGQLPAIIDFYADWCAPCKMVEPIFEQLSKEYAGRLVIYKIDTDKEKELSALFGIQTVPTFVFIPATDEDPFIEHGAFPKNDFIHIIEERLIVRG